MGTPVVYGGEKRGLHRNIGGIQGLRKASIRELIAYQIWCFGSFGVRGFRVGCLGLAWAWGFRV